MRGVKANRYDILTALLCILLASVVALRLIYPDEREERLFAELTLSIEELKIKADIPSEVLCDGRFSFDILSLDGDIAKLSCDCLIHPAGVMARGGKLLTRNQPLELLADSFFMRGRIKEVEVLRKVG